MKYLIVALAMCASSFALAAEGGSSPTAEGGSSPTAEGGSSPTAEGGASYLVVSGLSLHLGAHDLRELNPGLGLEVGQYHAGFYRNSMARESVYAGRDWRAALTPSLSGGVVVGAVSGYHIGRSNVVPLVAPFVSWERGHYGVNLALLPNPIQWDQSALALQLKVRLQ